MKRNRYLPLVLITLLGAILRFYNLDWGDGFYFHPDEGNMGRSVAQLTLEEGFHPNFFAYGQFPLYLAYFSNYLTKTAITTLSRAKLLIIPSLQSIFPTASNLNPQTASFTEAIFWLRFWSAAASTLTIPVVYLITKHLFSNKKAPKQVRGVRVKEIDLPESDKHLHYNTTDRFLSSIMSSSASNNKVRREGDLHSIPDRSGTRSLSDSASTLEVHPPHKTILANLRKNLNIFPLLAALFAAFTPGLIQAAHFGTTESLLAFFLLLILYLSLQILPKTTRGRKLLFLVIAVGAVSGLALGTKLSAAFFLPAPILAIVINSAQSQTYLAKIKKLFIFLSVFFVFGFSFFILSSPYSLLESQEFWRISTYEANVATGEIQIFYTRQFTNTTPLLFQATHVFPYALGLPLFILGSFGFLYTLCSKFKAQSTKHKVISNYKKSKSQTVWNFKIGNWKLLWILDFGFWILSIAFLAYFLPNAMLFAKWVRFMTPILPFFAIFAAYALYTLANKKTPITRGLLSVGKEFLPLPLVNRIISILSLNLFVKQPKLRRTGDSNSTELDSAHRLTSEADASPVHPPLTSIITILLAFLSIIPGVIFFKIYTQPDVRIAASDWIYANVPDGSYILSEAGNVVNLPLDVRGSRLKAQGQEYNLEPRTYNVVNFDFYHLDSNPELQEQLVNHLLEADYLIVPSRRIFANHTRLPEQFPISTNYHLALFTGTLGFELVHTEKPYPNFQFSIFNFQFGDEVAEETWSVFDHPVVRVFKKTRAYDQTYYEKILSVK